MLNKGNLAEKIALNLLKKRGYKILDKNFKVPKIGEIDILAFKDKKIHCIEVKSSWSKNNKFLWEKILGKKLKRILKTFEIWLKIKGPIFIKNLYEKYDLEIDLIEIKKTKNKIKFKITHNI